MAIVYRFLIFDRRSNCRLDRDFFKKLSPTREGGETSKTAQPSTAELSSSETMELIIGTCHSLKSMLSRLEPLRTGGESEAGEGEVASASSQAVGAAERGGGLARSGGGRAVSFSYRTNKYRLHYYESATGWKFVMLTSPSSGPVAAPSALANLAGPFFSTTGGSGTKGGTSAGASRAAPAASGAQVGSAAGPLTLDTALCVFYRTVFIEWIVRNPLVGNDFVPCLGSAAGAPPSFDDGSPSGGSGPFSNAVEAFFSNSAIFSQ